jgi:hypothetical protein
MCIHLSFAPITATHFLWTIRHTLALGTNLSVDPSGRDHFTCKAFLHSRPLSLEWLAHWEFLLWAHFQHTAFIYPNDVRSQVKYHNNIDTTSIWPHLKSTQVHFNSSKPRRDLQREKYEGATSHLTSHDFHTRMIWSNKYWATYRLLIMYIIVFLNQLHHVTLSKAHFKITQQWDSHSLMALINSNRQEWN